MKPAVHPVANSADLSEVLALTRRIEQQVADGRWQEALATELERRSHLETLFAGGGMEPGAASELRQVLERTDVLLGRVAHAQRQAALEAASHGVKREAIAAYEATADSHDAGRRRP
jgi:hypothetical protein